MAGYPGQGYHQSHSPYPPQGQGQGGYPPPNQSYGEQNYAQQPYGQQPYGQPPNMQGQGYGYAPPSGPPPGQGQYGAPPGPPPGQGQYGAPQGPPPGQGQYGAPHGPPPGQMGYGAPPGPPPPQGGYGQQPPMHQQQPPPGTGGYYGGQQSGPPARPSPGYNPNQMAQMDMGRAADDLRAAMKGFGTDEKALIGILSKLGPLQINSTKQAFQQRHKRDLMKDVKSETSGYFREGLLAICRGPLEQDCHTLQDAIQGIGTKEAALNEVLLNRSNADINAIKSQYQQMFRKSLESDVKGDLSMKTARLFDMILSARRNEESSPVIPQQTDADATEIYKATEGTRMGADQVTVCSILTSRSDGQIRAISQAYGQKYQKPLDQVLKSEFSGHMEDALLFILHDAEDRAKHDAQMLEESMKGAGTKDEMLVRRIIRFHWEPQRLQQCKAAYRHFYKRDLADRIKGETRGDYEKLMVACIA
ncbi:hypothetical protein MBLNU230_g3082t1 [Neophaeotheca triangularis]